MPRLVGLLCVVGFFGSLIAANAQTPAPSTAGTTFDGTYALVSAAKVNQTYTARSGQLGQCPDRRAGPLHIENGRVRYTTATGNKLRGTVGPQGELAMRIITPPNTGGGYRPVEINLSGSVDGSGTVRARQIGNSCSYDFVWQKAPR
jgi:hypothetical protein